MDRNTLWNLFVLTGSPEVYLLYRQSVREDGLQRE